MSGLVRVDRRDTGVALVVLDNPPVNALTNATIDALDGAAASLGPDPDVRAIVLTGADEKAFAAGADLGEFSAALGNREWIEDHTSARAGCSTVGAGLRSPSSRPSRRARWAAGSSWPLSAI